MVALVLKAKPDWQKGKYNGVGGSVEPGETPHEAMVREFREETGIETASRDWSLFAVDEGPDHRCYFYRGLWPHGLSEAECKLTSLPDEPVRWWNAEQLPLNIIPNLALLVPAAMLADQLIEPIRLH